MGSASPGPSYGQTSLPDWISNIELLAYLSIIMN